MPDAPDIVLCSKLCWHSLTDPSVFDDLNPRLSLLCQVGDVVCPCKICGGCQIRIPTSFRPWIHSTLSNTLLTPIRLRRTFFYVECNNTPNPKTTVDPHLSKSLFSLDPYNLQLHCFLGSGILFCCLFVRLLDQSCKMLGRPKKQ